MPKFNIEVQWHYKSFDYVVMEVEGATLEEAKDKALALAESGHCQVTCWTEGQIYDAHYEINHDECEEIQC